MQFKVNQGNRQGDLHIERNIECQDAVFTLTKKDVCVICLADGAGSRSMSGVGAEAVSKSIGKLLCSDFRELCDGGEMNIRLSVSERISECLRELSAKYGKPCDQFASTLLFAAADGERYICGHLGDGCIICLREDTWNVLSFPQNGNGENQTYLTASPKMQNHLRVQVNMCRNIRGFILLSDGMMPSIFGDNFSYDSTDPLINELCKKIEQATFDDASFVSCSWQL